MATYPTVEMYLNAAWTDITTYVYYRDMIEITRGQSGEGSRTDTSSCRMTLDNRDGRWSPRNPTGPYYGQLTRNVPIRVSIDAGESYLNLTGATDERATTPDAAALDITGDIDIRMELSLDNWSGGSDSMELAAKFDVMGNNRSWLVYLTGNTQIAYRWSADGSATTESQSDTIYLPHYVRRAIRITHDVNDGAGNNVVTFYTADSIEGPWTEISADTNAGTTSIFSSNAAVEIGDIADLLGDNLPGRIYKAQIYNGINGTLVADADFTVVAAGSSSFVDSEGLTWTVGGTATISSRKTRFIGEVSSLVIDGDKSGRDATVKLEAAGLMRRLSQGKSPIDSALRRYIRVNNPVECWPLTDGSQAVVAKSLVGGGDMVQTIDTTLGDFAAEFAAGALGAGIEPVILVQPDCTGKFSGGVPNSSSAASKWSVDLFLSGGGNEAAGGFVISDRGAGTDADNRIEFFIVFNGNLDSLATTWTAYGETSSSTSLLTSGASAFVYDINLHHIRLTMDPLATTTDWEMYVDGVLLDSGNIAVVVKAVRNVELRWGFLTIANETMTSRSFGYITYWDGTGPTAAQIWDAANGFADERAGNRLSRLTTEESLTYQRIGESTTTPQMGIQIQDQLLDILRDCETADMGFLYEPREVLGLAYRDRESLYNQTARLTLDYAQNQLSETLLPVEDDKTIHNDITVKQTYGSTLRTTLDSGSLSTLDPPNGVGRYDESIDVNLYLQDDLPDQANWRLHMGTVDEARYPQISLNLRHSTFTASASAMEDALRLDLGDRLLIQNPPSWVPPDDIELIAVGFSETFGIRERDIVINCVPASPYNIAIADAERYNHIDTDGSSLTSSVTSSAASFEVTTQAGSAVWVHSIGYPDDFPFDIKVGGEIMTALGVGTSGLILNTNPSFESGTTSWTATNASITQSSDRSRGGNYSCKLTSSAGTSPRAEDSNRAVTAGQTYTAAGWLYAPSTLPTDATVSVNWYDSGAAFLSTSSTSQTLTAGSWTSVSGSFTAPVGAAYAGVHFSISGTPGAGYVLYADNVVLLDDTKTDTASPQLFHVIRSVNGVTKSHSSAADVRLAYPAIAAL